MLIAEIYFLNERCSVLYQAGSTKIENASLHSDYKTWRLTCSHDVEDAGVMLSRRDECRPLKYTVDGRHIRISLSKFAGVGGKELVRLWLLVPSRTQVKTAVFPARPIRESAPYRQAGFDKITVRALSEISYVFFWEPNVAYPFAWCSHRSESSDFLVEDIADYGCRADWRPPLEYYPQGHFALHLFSALNAKGPDLQVIAKVSLPSRHVLWQKGPLTVASIESIGSYLYKITWLKELQNPVVYVVLMVTNFDVSWCVHSICGTSAVVEISAWLGVTGMFVMVADAMTDRYPVGHVDIRWTQSRSMAGLPSPYPGSQVHLLAILPGAFIRYGGLERDSGDPVAWRLRFLLSGHPPRFQVFLKFIVTNTYSKVLYGGGKPVVALDGAEIQSEIYESFVPSFTEYHAFFLITLTAVEASDLTLLLSSTRESKNYLERIDQPSVKVDELCS